MCFFSPIRNDPKKTHKQIFGLAPTQSRDNPANLFMCFFWVFPYGGEKHINKIPQKNPGQSREYFVYVFFLSLIYTKEEQTVCSKRCFSEWCVQSLVRIHKGRDTKMLKKTGVFRHSLSL